jgi:plasmid stabilization system protein ParE
MKKYNIKIEPEALEDIRKIVLWYNKKREGLGISFKEKTIVQIDSLDKYAHLYAIRYKEFRCMNIEKFPYMVHYYINESTSTVEVFAVFSTSRNPKIWTDRIEGKI